MGKIQSIGGQIFLFLQQLRFLADNVNTGTLQSVTIPQYYIYHLW
jgi:hypothetical protein